MRALILHMIQLEPDARLSAKEYLTNWGPSLFPDHFTSFLQPFGHTLLPMNAGNCNSVAVCETVVSPIVMLCQLAVFSFWSDSLLQYCLCHRRVCAVKGHWQSLSVCCAQRSDKKHSDFNIPV